MRSKLLATAAILAALVLVTSGCLESADLDLPIQIRGADDVGALGFELVYDELLLEAIGVTPDDFAKGPDAGFNIDIPGRVKVVIQNAPNINGDGTVVTIQFKLLWDSGTTDLVIEAIQARNMTTHEYISEQAQAEPGNFRADDMSYMTPTIVFVP